MRKTTDIRTMKKIINEYIANNKNILPLAVEYWNELAMGYFIEHEELKFVSNENCYKNEEETFSVNCIEDLIKECIYWLSCYYEWGNMRNEKEEFNDRKAFIKFLSVFIPLSPINFINELKRQKIPMNKDTEYLYIVSKKEEVKEEEKIEEENKKNKIDYEILKPVKNTIVNNVNIYNIPLAKFSINDYSHYEIRLIKDSPLYIMISYYNSDNGSYGNSNIFKFDNGKNDNYFNITVMELLNTIINEKIEDRKRMFNMFMK